MTRQLTRTYFVALLGVFLLPGVAAAQPVNDQAFVDRAAKGLMARIDYGMLAHTEARLPEINAFTANLVREHWKAKEGLQQTAKKLDLSWPNEINERAKDEIEVMQNLRPDNFDEYFLNALEKTVWEDLAYYRKSVRSEGLSRPLADWANDRLSVLEGLAQRINELQKKAS